MTRSAPGPESEFLRAWEAGAFEHRVELVEGAVWPVAVGTWHGDAVGQLLALLPRTGVRVTTATLPTGGSLPDPDCWVRRDDADPIPTGYRTRVEYRTGERIPVRYADTDLAVDDVITT